MSSDTPGSGTPATVRLDKWLIAARMFKTRPLAQEACDGGHVTVNDRAAAPARAVKSGDIVVALTHSGKKILRITGLEEKRGPAAHARTLYDDLTPPTPPSEEPVALRGRGAGRPTKRDRRLIDRTRGLE
ncbi:MAG: RNA-binding S4 domain-containing protein [Pseudomonadota bacterium]|nr:RNA-binding S4 domain-containing protein [Pseudomonadota bacterium]